MKNILIYSIAINCFVSMNVLAADENYYGVEWNSKEVLEVFALGYSPENISQSMYEANSSCSKSVKSVSKDKQYVCIKYSCGWTTWSYIIDEYRESGKVKSSSDGSLCRW